MSFLKALGIDQTIQEKALAAKQHAAEVEAQTSQEGFPQFELPEKTTKICSFLPGCGTFEAFAGVYADGDFRTFAEAEATPQFTKLGFSPTSEIPDWSMIPERYAAPGMTSTLFVGGKGIKNSGSIDYSEYPARRLRELPADHPRNRALKIPGKYGLPSVRNQIYLYVVEHTMANGKLDNAKLKADLEAGNFVKLLRLNGPSYAALKSAAQAAQMSGARYITDYHLIVQWGDFSKKTYNFNTNMTEPAWHSAELLPLVLKEIKRIGPPSEHADVRRLSDDEFAALVEAVTGAPQQVAS
jgi:hypothetical protein